MLFSDKVNRLQKKAEAILFDFLFEISRVCLYARQNSYEAQKARRSRPLFRSSLQNEAVLCSLRAALQNLIRQGKEKTPRAAAQGA